MELARLKRRFVAIATILGVISAGLLTYLLWPGSAGPRPAELREQYISLKSEVALWKKSNPDAVRSDLNQFYSADVPSKWSEISQRMEKLIQATGVTASSGIHYPVDNQEKGTLPGVEQVKIETTVTGDYSKVARFINALEQDKTFFIIDKIALSSQEGGTVSLNISVVTFLRQT
ncbi:MAG TPA: GspMb/PilO family protein [Candidatus Angelobacter sp.]|nr:GspMb/PilO family protein [Candidatus Angelobacter sp.]